MVQRLIALVCLAVAIRSSFGATPSFIKPCKLEDTACIRRAAQAALPKFAAGIPELNVPPSDPVFLEKIEFNDKGLKANYTNIDAKGFKDTIIEDLEFSVKTKTLSMKTVFPFTLAGDYVLKGRLLILPVEGQGKFNIVAKKSYAKVTAELITVRGDDGKKHFNIKNFQLTEIGTIERSIFSFANLFNGNKQLSDGVHKFANDNYQEITRELAIPLFQGLFKKFFRNINKLFKAVPVDDLIVQ